MTCIVTIILLVTVQTVCNAQHLEAAAGGTATGQGIALSWSIGEVIIGIVSDNAFHGSIGFQQNYNFTFTGLEESDPINLTLFPNPARDFVVLELESGYQNDVQLTVFNLSGATVMQKTIAASSRKIELDISVLASGPYKIILVWPNGKLGSIGFIKL
jgi:hypothetical protein